MPILKKSGSIVISVGDDGAIVSCVEKSKLLHRAFLPGPFSSDLAEICGKYPKFSIYILLDTIDQNYVFSNLPALRSGSVMKMVKRKMTNEFDENDYNSYICLGKDDSSPRKDLKYVFISVRNSTPLTDWLEAIATLPNHFAGFYLYPVESEEFVAKIRKVAKSEGKLNKSDWEILISHNRVGGFRQVVLKDGKIIFTRISQASGLQSPDAIGVNLSQEISNTLEYIRRIGYSEQPLSIYIVTSKEASQFIEIPSVDPKSIYLSTPYDISQKLNIESAAQENDKFGDVIFAASFVSSKKNLKFMPKDFKKVNTLYTLMKATNMALIGLLAIVPIVLMYFLVYAFILSSELGDQEVKVDKIKADLSKITDFEEKHGLNPDFVIKLVETKGKINDADKTFLDPLVKYKNSEGYKSYVQSYQVRQNEDSDKSTLIVKTKLDISEVNNYNDLFEILDGYQANIKSAYDGRKITFEKIPTRESIQMTLDELQRTKTQEVGLTVE
jgi:hypothetical protein